jgi:transcriptional regulator of acetoin/glycerol metabolism
VPVQHPIIGKTIGAVDLTCWCKDAGKLLLALARTTAEQVRQALLTYSNVRELALFQSYLQACRRTTGIVIAWGDELVMTNSCGHKLLDPADQEALLGHAKEALRGSARANAIVTLPTGNKVRMRCHRVSEGGQPSAAGGVLTVRSLEGNEDLGAAPSSMVPMFLPGIVGSAPAWVRCCHQVDAHYREGDRLVLAGEPGTGKCALVRAVHQRHNPAGRLRTVDAREEDCVDRLRRDLLDDPADTLLIRHADRLGADAVAAVADMVRQAGEQHAERKQWITVTVGPEPETQPELAELLVLFPHTAQVPPLRRHIEDLSELVPLLLSTLCHGNRLTCSSAAMHLLMRATWPGNVAQLYQALKSVAKLRRAGTIQPSDLPPEYRTAGRRLLNRLESLERDAIVQCLEDTGGNKSRAAQSLGMSRATIYRKIHDYGIVTSDR